MTGQPDPERLLAEALRAQAVRAPLPDATSGPDPLVRLFSGADPRHDLISGRVPDTVGVRAGAAAAASTTARLPIAPSTQLSAWWIVLLAVLLGLAAGAVIGLISIV